MHSPQHACNELVDTVALFNKWHERGDAALVVRRGTEMGEY